MTDSDYLKVRPRRVKWDSSLWGMMRRALKISKDPAELLEYAALPSYGQVYLNHLVGEFESLKNLCQNVEALKLADQIAVRAAGGNIMTWGDAYALDDAITQMLPVEYLHQRAWCLEVRYRDAVGNAEAYDSFMKVESAHFVNESEAHIRARMHNLIRELYRLYTVIACRESMREELSLKARMTLLFILSLIAAFSVIASFTNHGWVDIWGLVFAAGATGGLVSLQRRLQSLPSHGESLGDLVELSSGMTIKFTPLLGGTFAVVLFLLFCSGVLSSPVFPEFQSKPDIPDFVTFATHVAPSNTAAWGKLLVWSFIAGFAERFVPDTLDRLIAKSEQGKQRPT
jgi:hypothetical protein